MRGKKARKIRKQHGAKHVRLAGRPGGVVQTHKTLRDIIWTPEKRS